MILPKGSILRFAEVSTPTTKHDLPEDNRSEVSVTVERIEKSQRMHNGRLRKWFVADKRSWDVSWDLLPHDSAFTLAHKWGGEDLEQWFDEHPGEFYLYVRLPDASEEQFLVHFKSFSKKVQKRGRYEMWGINMSLEEI